MFDQVQQHVESSPANGNLLPVDPQLPLRRADLDSAEAQTRPRRGPSRARRRCDILSAFTQPEDTHRLRDVFDHLVTHVHIADIDTPRHDALDGLRHHHATGFGQAFQPRGDVDAVAVDRAIGLFDHVTDVNTDAKAHASIFGNIALDRRSQLTLNRQCRFHCRTGVLEDGQHSVTGHVDHAPVVACNARAEHRTRHIQCRHSAAVVLRHQTRVTDRVCGKYGQ